MARKTTLSNLFSSTVVWILLILAVFDVFLVRVRPLQYVTDLRFIPLDQHPMVSKIPVYLESREQADLLILGSSLPMCAIAEYDEKCYGEPHCKVGFEMRRYLGARYLEQELAQPNRPDFKIANMSIVGCMASDMYTILCTSLHAGKRPARLLICISPRDFVDNMVQPIGRTPAFELLRDWKSLEDVFRPGLCAAERKALIFSSIWYFYRVKVDYRTVITQYCANLFRRPTSLYYASRPLNNHLAVVTDAKYPTTLAGFNKAFARCYEPANTDRFVLEMKYFQKLLALASRENIPCVVVNMPVSASHRALLDAKLQKRYMLDSEKACDDTGAIYFDFNDQDFSNHDFSDGFHLNALGAGKFQKRLIQNLLSSLENEKFAIRH